MAEKTSRVVIVGRDTELVVAVATGLMAAEIDISLVGEPDFARRILEKQANRRSPLIVAVGKDGEGLKFIRELREEETVQERPRRPMIAVSEMPLPDAGKLCDSTGADAILPRSDIRGIVSTVCLLAIER